MSKAKFRIRYKLADDGEKRILIEERTAGLFGYWNSIGYIFPSRDGADPQTRDAVDKLIAIIKARHNGQDWAKREPIYFDAVGKQV